VNAAANQPPTASAGSDITLTLPTNSTSLVGTGSDADGTISAYTWTRVSGPTTYTLGSANASTTTLTNLVQGTYVFRLRVTDNSGSSATDDITIIVNPAPVPVNQAPVARVEPNIALTLPTNTTLVHGNASSDPDGVITYWLWTQVSGPNQAVITNGNTSVASVSGLVEGVYTFQLKVSDDLGASSTATLTVTVNQGRNGQKATLSVYPNPSTGIVNIAYVSNLNGKLKISVYNMHRQLMKQATIEKTQSSLTTALDITSFNAGIYLIEIVSPDKKKTTKQVVKM
jgi:hypothetical protein